MHAGRICASFYYRTPMITELIGTYNWNSADGRWSIKRAWGKIADTPATRCVFNKRYKSLTREFPSARLFCAPACFPRWGFSSWDVRSTRVLALHYESFSNAMKLPAAHSYHGAFKCSPRPRNIQRNAIARELSSCVNRIVREEKRLLDKSLIDLSDLAILSSSSSIGNSNIVLIYSETYELRLM